MEGASGLRALNAPCRAASDRLTSGTTAVKRRDAPVLRARAGARLLIADAVDRGGMSARGVHRALRVARTIADLAGEEGVSALRLAEALQYRAYETRRIVSAS
jgi:magnesium chelatase family protein